MEKSKMQAHASYYGGELNLTFYDDEHFEVNIYLPKKQAKALANSIKSQIKENK